MKGYGELKDEVKQLIDDVLPRLDLIDLVELSSKGNLLVPPCSSYLISLHLCFYLFL